MSLIWRDTRYALRGLRRTPGFAAAAILMLGLGIGANAAIFSIVDAAIFKPLPYRDPEQLVIVRQVLQRGTAEQVFQIGMTWDQVDRWRREPQIFSGLETYTAQRVPVEGPTGVSQRFVSFVSPGMAALLGIRPILGRNFVADDATADPIVALLSEDYWASAFSRSPGVLGQTITVDSRRRTIVGVMPAMLRWGVGGGQVAAWLPLDERSERGPGGRVFIGAIARLRSGLTLSSANADMARTIERTDAAVPPDRRYDADLMPLDSRAMFDDTKKTGLALTALWAAAEFVFLIACANVANLVLTRALDRQREIAVRTALGATSSRLFRQFFTEGLIVVAGGVVCAIALASWTAHVLPAVVPDRLQLFDANPLTFDRRTLAFSGLAILIAIVVCSVIPALRALAGRVSVGLERSPRIAGVDAGARRVRVLLQAAQVTLTLVLLTGAGLLTTSLVRMLDTKAGYDIDRLLTASVVLPTPRYSSRESRTVFLQEVLARINAVPGLRATSALSPAGGLSGRFAAFGRETQVTTPGSALSIFFVEPDYFAVTGIPLQSGRVFSDPEARSGLPVAVIDERAAALHWPGQSAIGQRFRYSPYAPWLTVVGIAGHVKTRAFTSANGTIQAYVPARVSPLLPVRSPLLVHSEGDASKAFSAVRSIVTGIDPAVQLEDESPVTALYDDVFREPRFFAALMTVFAGLALLTASVGQYALVSYAVTQRTREIGVRIALGANLHRIVRLVLRDALVPIGVGLAAGTCASWWLSRFLSSLLYGITPHDPGTLALVTALLVGVACLAAYLPARRATRIDPIVTLRAE